MKSRDEIVIIMLQWLRLYTLGSRGSRELKTFLETRLISSRVDQKLKNKEELHEFLKRELSLESWMMEAVVGAIFKRRGGFSFSMSHGFNFGSILTKFRGEFGPLFPRFRRYEWTTIEPRSGHDRASIVVLSLRRSLADQWRTIPHHFRFISASIAARSRRDRVLPGVSSAVRLFDRDEDPMLQVSPRSLTGCR